MLLACGLVANCSNACCSPPLFSSFEVKQGDAGGKGLSMPGGISKSFSRVSGKDKRVTTLHARSLSMLPARRMDRPKRWCPAMEA